MTQPNAQLHRVIVGTAGHIDHGKTSLVRALTGIDCDRWAEEKARGITIDLGFAHLTAGDVQIGFIDVPGHERFLHNALAGLGGVRIMLLVVAADEGVKPQTREHLAICSQLEIPFGLVAVTRSDLATPDRLEQTQRDVRELLATTRFADASLIPVSSLTGDGIETLKSALLEMSARTDTAETRSLPARLPIDRAFHLKGLGLVVTGTLLSGTIRRGSTLQVLPGAQAARVRSVQVHGGARDEAVAGERVSLQIAGAELSDLARGMQLVEPDCFATTTTLCARITILPDVSAVTEPIPVRLHLYSGSVEGRLRPLDCEELRPGQTGLVEIRLNEAVVAVRGDRFIVCQPSPVATLGGGEVLDPIWRPRRMRALAPALGALQGTSADALRFWIEDAGESGVNAEALARRLGISPDELRNRLATSTASDGLRAVRDGDDQPSHWVSRAAYDKVVTRSREVLEDCLRRDPLGPGICKAAVLSRVLPARARKLGDVYLAWLENDGLLAVSADRITVAGAAADRLVEQSSAVASVLDRFANAGLNPPNADVLQAQLGAENDVVERAIGYLVRRGRLLKLSNDLVFDAAAISRLSQELVATDWHHFAVPKFKEKFGLTRRWAIPLLEYLDSTGITRRVGDEREIVRNVEMPAEVSSKELETAVLGD